MHWYVSYYVIIANIHLFSPIGGGDRMSKADEYIPEFTKGESIPIASLSLPEGKTSPPEYLTEAELIGLMVCIIAPSLFPLAC